MVLENAERPHDRRAVLADLLGFSNCGFMGYPIILAVNPEWMIYAVAYNGGFGTVLSEGRDLFEAARYGNATGALSVTKLGTAPAMPARAEIDAMVKQNYGM